MSKMELKKIVKEVRAFYADHEDLDEMVTDLSDGKSIDYWANRFSEKDYPQNLELARELYLIELTKCESSYDFNNLAYNIANKDGLNDQEVANEIYERAIETAEYLRDYTNIASNISDKEKIKKLYLQALEIASDIQDNMEVANSIAENEILNDKEWTKEIFKKVEENLEELRNYNELIHGINNYLDDKAWATNIANKAIEKLKDADDIFEFIGDSSEILTLGEFVAIEDGMNNKELAKEIFDINKDYESITDLLDSARKVIELYEEEDYATEYSQAILDKAIELVESGYYCDIYFFIKDDLKDEDRAYEFRDEYDDEMREDDEEYGNCAGLFEDEDSIDIDDIDFDNLDDGKSIIGFTTNTMTFSVGEDMLDSDDNYLPEFYEIANENISEFLNAIKEKLGGFINNKIAISIDDQIKEYQEGMLDNSIEDYENILLYVVATKEIPADMLNALFLDMSDYGFYAMFKNNNTDETIIQGYDYGEYDSGYFSNGQEDYYINNYKDNVGAKYKEVETFLLNNE